MATDPTLAEIAAEIDVLETLDAFGAELDEFTSNLSAYSGQDLSVLSSDSSIVIELAQLKSLATTLSETLADADEVLGKGPGAAAKVTSLVHDLQKLAHAATSAEELTGPQRLDAMGELVGNIESIATALTGLGALNPVIGIFLGLYGTALHSAATTAAYLQTVHDQTIDVIARTDGIGDEAEDAASRHQPAPPDPQLMEARRAAQARLEELYADRARAIARRDANELKRARDHCARTHRAELEEAAKTASRLDFRAHMSGDGMNGDTAAALEEWLATPQEGFGEALAAASQQEDPELAAEVADRARQVMDIKRAVAARMRGYRDCVDGILEHGFQLASGAVGGATGGVAAARPSRRVLALAAGGVLAVAAAGALLLGSGGGDDDTSADTADTDAVAAEDQVTSTDDDTAGDESPDTSEGSTSEEELHVDFLVVGGRASYVGSTDLPAGETVTLVIDVVDDNGDPDVGREMAVTIGEPPSGPDAVHAEATTDENGRATFTVSLPPEPGTSVLYSFDGTEVHRVTPVRLI